MGLSQDDLPGGDDFDDAIEEEFVPLVRFYPVFICSYCKLLSPK